MNSLAEVALWAVEPLKDLSDFLERCAASQHLGVHLEWDLRIYRPTRGRDIADRVPVHHVHAVIVNKMRDDFRRQIRFYAHTGWIIDQSAYRFLKDCQCPIVYELKGDTSRGHRNIASRQLRRLLHPE